MFSFLFLQSKFYVNVFCLYMFIQNILFVWICILHTGINILLNLMKDFILELKNRLSHFVCCILIKLFNTIILGKGPQNVMEVFNLYYSVSSFNWNLNRFISNQLYTPIKDWIVWFDLNRQMFSLKHNYFFPYC